MRYTIPNILTLLRIALIPLFVVVYYVPAGWGMPLSALVFMFAAITDWMDGYLARKLDQASPFGAFLDPVADKLIVVVALVMLVERHGSLLLVLPTLIIIGREITVSALREWMAELGERGVVAVSFIGKLKTTLQMIALLLLLFYRPLLGIPIYEIGLILLYIAAILTLWSMWLYLLAARPVIFPKE